MAPINSYFHRHLTIDMTRPIYGCERNLLKAVADLAAEKKRKQLLSPLFLSVDAFIAKNNVETFFS